MSPVVVVASAADGSVAQGVRSQGSGISQEFAPRRHGNFPRAITLIKVREVEKGPYQQKYFAREQSRQSISFLRYPQDTF
jgi:hypothetical protein